MITWCWSVKGGVGTSVVSAATALQAAEHGEAVLVDLAGDQPALLAVDAPGPGFGDWARAGEEVAAEALARLLVPVGAGLRLLPRGPEPLATHDPAVTDRLDVVLAVLHRPGTELVVDAGALAPRCGDHAVRSVLVLRACYLALRRATAATISPPADVVVISEPGRALRGSDVSAALGAGRVVTVPWDPAVARAVDAGTFVARRPRGLRALRSLREAR